MWLIIDLIDLVIMAAGSGLKGIGRSKKQREGGDAGGVVTHLPLFMLKVVWVVRIGRHFLRSHRSGLLLFSWCFHKFQDGSTPNRTVHP
jgi:hypothetical protein